MLESMANAATPSKTKVKLVRRDCESAGDTSMGMLQREKNRNAKLARNSFVTKRAELKLNVLADTFAKVIGDRCTGIEQGTLSRTVRFEQVGYIDALKFVYNWENRFMAVNYNLQTIVEPKVDERYDEIGSCTIEYSFKGKSDRWSFKSWSASDEQKAAYTERLNNPLILDRIKALDIFDLEIGHNRGASTFTISIESMIGSATWILIPPIIQLIKPTEEECTKFIELFELISDALINNR